MLSIVLAVYNEEENICKCLESVKKIADEIIVVDGGSNDGTVGLAKKYTSKITITDNPPIFHINKQKAVDLATGDWILQLDADEVVTRELADEIAAIIKCENPCDGYYLKRKNFLLNRWLSKGGQYPDPVIRLFKKGKGKFPCKSVHEQIEISGVTGTLNNDLLHYTAPTFKRYLTNSNRYTSLTAMELLDRNIPLNAVSFLKYMFIKPFVTFLMLYLRHKGFYDGFPGFVFAYFSGFHYIISFIKYWEMKNYRK